MSFSAMFRVSELCEKGSPFSELPSLSGNRLRKQQASCAACTLGLQSPCSSAGCFLLSLLKNHVCLLEFQAASNRNTAAALDVAFHGCRIEQHSSKGKRQGLYSQHCSHLCHVQAWFCFAHLKSIQICEEPLMPRKCNSSHIT